MACIVLFPDFYEHWFRDPLLDQADMSFQKTAVNYKFGAFLLFLQIAEIVALKWKSDAVFHRIRSISASEASGYGIFLLWIFHTAVSVLLGLNASQSFGMDINSDDNWAVGLLFVIVIKELFLLAFLIDLKEITEIRPAVPVWKETIADVILLVFNAVAYTIIWEYLAFDPESSLVPLRSNMPLFFVEATAALLLFCMTILPLKIPWLTELWYTSTFDRRTAASLMSLLSIAFIALSPITIGHSDLYQALLEPHHTTRLFLTGFAERRLPPDIEQLQYLNVLYIKQGGLESIPPEIGELKELRYLNIQSTRISTIPKEVGSLESLRTLILRRNQLTSLPGEIEQLGNLRILDLSRNRLKSLPSGIHSLQNLRELKLSGNPLPKDAVETLRKELPHTKIEF